MIGEPTWRTGLADWVSALAPHPEGDVVACGSLGGDAVVVDAASGEVVAKLPAHPMGVLRMAWRPGGDRLAITGQDEIVRVVDRAGVELAATDVGGWAEAVVWSPNGQWLAVGAGRVVHLFDADGRLAARLDEERSTVTALAFSVDGRRLGVAAYGGIRWYEPQRLPATDPVRDYEWKGSLLSIALAPNGKWACGGAQDQSIHLWRLWSGKDLQMSGYPSKIEHLAFRHDSRWMASACLGELTVWDFGGKGPAGTAPAAGTAHDRHITDLAWEPGGERLMTAGADGRLALWRSPTKAGADIRPRAVVEADEGASALAWMPGAAAIVVGRADGTVEQRPVPVES